ncbi:MAG TPA: porin family protein [Mucilaginibacter sp.]|nr:porin family protein [Mucilaginibacter sp.]
MKRNILLTFAGLVLPVFLFSGCVIKEMHESAEGSIDAGKNRYSGVSPIKNGFSESGNVGYLMVEEWQFGMGGNFVGHKEFDQPDPLGSSDAGGPSDGRRRGNYSLLSPRAAAEPANYWSLSEELEFIGKGNKIDAGGGDSETDHLYYLEVPVLMNYNMKINGGNNLYFGLGPYVAAGLFAHFHSVSQGQTTSGSLNFGSNADYPRMDYGLQAKAGYMITPKISLSLNYDFGLRNIGDPVDKAYNNVFGLSVGYRLK